MISKLLVENVSLEIEHAYHESECVFLDTIYNGRRAHTCG